MAKKAVNLRNGRAWGSRGEAISYFRELRDRQTLDTPINDPSDHDDLLALLERYDLAIADGPTKLGVGVEHFQTRVNVTNGGRNVGFWVVRRDGSETDFSFIRAINEAPKRGIEQLSDACRAAVSAELQTAKTRYFILQCDDQGRVPCCVTGDLIHEHSAALEYVERSFAELVRVFCASQGWGEDIPRGIISEPADAQTMTVFICASHANAFREFHRAEARVRVVRRRGNSAGATRATELLVEKYLEL